MQMMSNTLKPGWQARAELMQKLNIRHAMVDVFYYGEFTYTRFEDAMAQAMRLEPPIAQVEHDQERDVSL
jgi:hypothetical protein